MKKFLPILFATLVAVLSCTKQEDTSGLQKQIDEIKSLTSISYIPEYSDKNSVMWCYQDKEGKYVADLDTLRFEIRPSGSAKKIVESNDITISVDAGYNTLVKSSSSLVNLPLKEKSYDGDMLTVVVSGENLSQEFLSGKEGASCRLLVEAGEAVKMSEYVQMRSNYQNTAFFVPNTIKEFVGNVHKLNIVKYPSDASVIFSSSDNNVVVVDSAGYMSAVGTGTAIVTVTATQSKRSDQLTVTIESSSGSAKDLSASGTANSYIVPFAGTFKFKADVKGGSTEPLDGTPFQADVLWETFGTAQTPNVGDLISIASLVDNYIIFKTPDPVNNGNAVIAVKDASGNILWSWHIWICKGYQPTKDNQHVYNNNAGVMMDRNLGATSATKGDVCALGLLYQWGRKDPFLSGSSISSYDQQAASTLFWPSSAESSSSTGTIAYAVAHPTTFITYNSSNYDWYYTGSSSTDNTRWQSSKTMYDPCPPGWRVPDGGDSGVWSKALGSSSFYLDGPWDSTNKGMNFGSGNGRSLSYQFGIATTIWYPAASRRNYNDGSLYRVGIDGYYWPCTTNGVLAYYLYFGADHNLHPSRTNSRAYGQSVRCQYYEEKTSGTSESISKEEWIK